MATASGDEQLQTQMSGFGTSWRQPGPLAQGSPPPFIGTAGFFAQGYIAFTSGVNTGLISMVSQYSLVGGAGVVTVSPPLPSAPAAGDTFTIVPDCDKTQAQCRAYGNIRYYAGCDYIPLPEQAV